MTKPVEKKNPQPQKIKSKKIFLEFVLIGFVLAIAYGVWQNFEQIKNSFKTEKVAETPQIDIAAELNGKAAKTDIYALQQKIGDLQAALGTIAIKNSQAVDTSILEEKILSLETLINSVINGKADANSVLGLSARTDKLAAEVDRLSRINNEGALILTAVMMIKENALEGKDFSYGAEILSELGGNNPKISTEINTIRELSGSEILSDKQLSADFASIYKNLTTQSAEKQIEQSWQDRINSKLNQIISVKKINDKGKQISENEQDKLCATLRAITKKNNIKALAALLKNSDNEYIRTNDEISVWIKNVENKTEFSDAVNKISNYCLMLIRLNSLGLKNN